MKKPFSSIGVACLALALAHCSAPALMTVDDLPALEKPAGTRIPYGSDSLEFGELTLPPGTGPHPVIIWLHGGCWLAPFTVSHSRALAQALAREGFAMWNLEYRRVGNPGGGWPGTFLDVARGADHVRALAKDYPLDLSRVIVGGHSAGGHLALWLAARSKIVPGSDIYIERPLVPKAVIALAPAAGLTALQAKGVCGGVVDKLIGGSPDTFMERYAAAEPSRMLPLRIPQVILIGAHDSAWAWVGEAYAREALAAGDPHIRLVKAPHSGHFEMIDPHSSTWPLVLAAARSLAD